MYDNQVQVKSMKFIFMSVEIKIISNKLNFDDLHTKLSCLK